ncbi:10534_t:CDS:2 [Funneliformis caledonium]|uniref:10534_t:CDS:1 n=2 Tax=Funneliformis TaxID=1117308 RepID=A0A9N8YRH6_9GLOM|nr:15529_t:CDS:2 [Funneliformis mosseae]CAG8443093.1 10534_t:CDS:2 [Funneliformis caledonium]
MDDPNADTEWNDILRDRGILPPIEGPTEEEIFEEMDKVIRENQDKHLEDKTLDELDELEDEEDDRVLMEYRQKRIAEMKVEASGEKFGQVIHISKPDFIKEVTEASKEVWVVVHLFNEPIPECKLMNRHLSTLAEKYKAIKFVKIIGDQCIPNYPDRNLPTLLIYGYGDLKVQLVGISQLGGMNVTPQALENYLISIGVIEDSNKSAVKKDDYSTQKIIRNPATVALSDEDETDDD